MTTKEKHFASHRFDRAQLETLRQSKFLNEYETTVNPN